MKMFLFLITLVAQTTAFAFAVKTTADFEKPSLFSLAEFQDTLAEDGYWTVDAQNTGVASVMNVDQIYTDSSLTETIFLKLGLQQFESGTFNEVADGVAYQGETRDGVPYVLFFDGISRTRAKDIAKHIRNPDQKVADSSRVHSSRATIALRLLIPRAYAQQTCAGKSSLQQANSSLGDILGFRALASCALTAFDSAAGAVSSPFKSLWTLASNPTKFWNDTKQGWQNLKAFVLNFRSQMTGFFSSLANIDAEMLEEIACSMIGQVVAAGGVSILTAGIASGALAKSSVVIAAMIAKVNRFKNILQDVTRLKKLGRIRSLNGITKQVLSCAT